MLQHEGPAVHKICAASGKAFGKAQVPGARQLWCLEPHLGLTDVAAGQGRCRQVSLPFAGSQACGHPATHWAYFWSFRMVSMATLVDLQPGIQGCSCRLEKVGTFPIYFTYKLCLIGDFR